MPGAADDGLIWVYVCAFGVAWLCVCDSKSRQICPCVDGSHLMQLAWLASACQRRVLACPSFVVSTRNVLLFTIVDYMFGPRWCSGVVVPACTVVIL